MIDFEIINRFLRANPHAPSLVVDERNNAFVIMKLEAFEALSHKETYQAAPASSVDFSHEQQVREENMHASSPAPKQEIPEEQWYIEPTGLA